ncbi:SDR family oxidoreductase [Nemorincola caseinilytica]|uniref:SDR family oxidoreductase n=1 Tax=Nemorincola caseinilytica TaxID=2054315 RepID=A0ABP8NM60_9BACT
MNIVITGASRGIGYHTALELAKDPANRVIALSRNTAALDVLRSNAPHGNIYIFPADLATSTVADLEAILAPCEEVDVLINNAGVLMNKPFAMTDMGMWQRTFEANLFGTVKMVQAAIPLMQKSAVAHIVNIGSMGGVQGTSKFPGLAAYSASKAAIANLTECLAEELKPLNIKVNCLALGAVNTEMLNEAFPGYQAPVGAEEMARMVAHFCLHNHRFMNGKIVPVSTSTP